MFVSKVMTLVFNTPSTFFIAFLPRSKCLLISWLQSPSVVIWSPIQLYAKSKKKKKNPILSKELTIYLIRE